MKTYVINVKTNLLPCKFTVNRFGITFTILCSCKFPYMFEDDFIRTAIICFISELVINTPAFSLFSFMEFYLPPLVRDTPNFISDCI